VIGKYESREWRQRPAASNPPASGLVRAAAKWWVGYCWDTGVNTISQRVFEYLRQFKPDRPVTLYRFENADYDSRKRPVQWDWVSWSHDKVMVRGVIDALEGDERTGELLFLEQSISPDRIFTDYTFFPDDLKAAIEDAGGDSGMSEVLVYV
jgi:hypothetical protein